MRDYLRTFSLCFEFGKTTELQSRSRESGFKPPMSDAHLTIYRAVKLKSNPIRAHYRPNPTKHKGSFPQYTEQCLGLDLHLSRVLFGFTRCCSTSVQRPFSRKSGSSRKRSLRGSRRRISGACLRAAARNLWKNAARRFGVLCCA